MSEVSSQAPRAPLNDAEMAELERRLDALAPARDPLDLSMLDGYLTGVLLQPKPLPEAQWLPLAFDVEGRPLPESVDAEPLRALVRRRHAELNRAIHHRQWFDPWVFELDEDAEPLETVMPWVAGFATAMEHFPALMDMESPELLEPLAALYRAFLDPEALGKWLPPHGFTISCFPHKIRGASAGWTRAVAIQRQLARADRVWAGLGVGRRVGPLVCRRDRLWRTILDRRHEAEPPAVHRRDRVLARIEAGL